MGRVYETINNKINQRIREVQSHFINIIKTIRRIILLGS